MSGFENYCTRGINIFVRVGIGERSEIILVIAMIVCIVFHGGPLFVQFLLRCDILSCWKQNKASQQ